MSLIVELYSEYDGNTRSISFSTVDTLVVKKDVKPAQMPMMALEEDYNMLNKSIVGGLMVISFKAVKYYQSTSELMSDYQVINGTLSTPSSDTDPMTSDYDGMVNSIPGRPVYLTIRDSSGEVLMRKYGYVSKSSLKMSGGGRIVGEWEIVFRVGITT